MRGMARGVWVSGPAGIAQFHPPYGSNPAAGQDSLRFHRMVVRRLEHTREQKGYDNAGDDDEDSRWRKKDAPQALNHVPRSFQGIGSSTAIITPQSNPGYGGTP